MLVGGNLLMLIAGIAVDGMLITLTSYVQQVLGWWAVQFGLVAAVMTVTAVAGAIVSRRAVTRVGCAAGGYGCGRPACLCLSAAHPDIGGGFARACPARPARLRRGDGRRSRLLTDRRAVGRRREGLRSGRRQVDTSFAIGTALGIAICESVAAARAVTVGGPALPALTCGRQSAFGVASGLAALGLIAALTMPGTRPGTTRADGRIGFAMMNPKRSRSDSGAEHPGEAPWVRPRTRRFGAC